MDDSIVWREARSHQTDSDEEQDTESFMTSLPVSSQEPICTNKEKRNDPQIDASMQSSMINNPYASTQQPSFRFSHSQINLQLRRNLTALADPAQHRPKPEYQFDGRTRQPFYNWLEKALVAINPNADLILFSSQGSDIQVFIAQLSSDLLDQYSTKPINITLDCDEQITSILCLPIMRDQRTAIGLIGWTALVFGLSSGYIKFYNEQSICLLSLKFCDEPIVSLKLQTQKINPNARSQTHFPSIVDELLILYQTSAIVVDGACLYENLKISMNDVLKNKLSYEPAYNMENLPTNMTCHSWNFKMDSLKVIDADLSGVRSTPKFDIWFHDANRYSGETPKWFTRNLLLVGQNPFLSTYHETETYEERHLMDLFGTLLPWKKTLPSRLQTNQVAVSNGWSLFDDGRLATSIVTSPDKRLAVMTDNFGRVMLVDIINSLIVRIWKGYREAQCGWIEVKRSDSEVDSPRALFLVIYAPKRGLLEVWSVQRGPRVAAFNVGKNCRLLYAGFKMLNMRAESKHTSSKSLTEQSYGNNCYLLDAKSETIFSIEIPYTYSLHKYNDFKSKDQLLMDELTVAIERGSEDKAISAVIHNFELAESLQGAIHKVISSLQPASVKPIMENLISKIMKDYDNHSGETMSDEDKSIIELCKLIINLCTMFNELSNIVRCELAMPHLNRRLIDQYEDHPHEIDKFAEKLGWKPSEVLRYLSLMTLEQSYRKETMNDPWPNMEKPLTWHEFVACFDLEKTENGFDALPLRLRDTSFAFLKEDKVIKTSVLMFIKASENFYRLHASSNEPVNIRSDVFSGCHKLLDPPSALILLFEFWMSTKLCNYWKMWEFLQIHLRLISDELRSKIVTHDDEELLIETWKKVYQLILESDNVFAAIISTATIRSDTLRIMAAKEIQSKEDDLNVDDDDTSHHVDWECLCVDAERMSIISKQLEDIFLLRLLLNYSPEEGKLVEKFVYKVPQLSVANIMRAGPVIVSELIAQWVVNADIDPGVLTQPYGVTSADTPYDTTTQKERIKVYLMKDVTTENHDEHVKELLHHIKTSFPHSLNPDILLLNCIWEFCKNWTKTLTTSNRMRSLDRVFECLKLLSDDLLKYNAACLAYKTFFQRTFERLVIMIETNPTLLSPKCLRSRDTLSRRELNMSESCLNEFVSFCYKLNEFMLDNQNCQMNDAAKEKLLDKLSSQPLSMDDWWSAPSVVQVHTRRRKQSSQLGQDAVVRNTYDDEYIIDLDSDIMEATTKRENHNILVQTTLSLKELFDLQVLIELNRLATLMMLIFKLKIIKTYPLSLLGEESRQILKLDLQQSPGSVSEIKTRAGLLSDLRLKFTRRCIIGIVTNISEITSEVDFINNGETGISELSEKLTVARDIDIDAKQQRCRIGGPKEIKEPSTSSNVEKSDEAAKSTRPSYQTGTYESEYGIYSDWSDSTKGTKISESMTLFTHLLTLARDWQINCDELHLELSFELYRCYLDELATMVATRAQDKQTLANGLLKIASQRVLVMFALSPQYSTTEQWRKRADKWSMFQPSVANWLKSIQEEEVRHELVQLSFPQSLRYIGPRYHPAELNDEFNSYIEHSLGLKLITIRLLCERTKCILEGVTNYLDGQSNRLAYDLLHLLESDTHERFLSQEKKIWARQADKILV